MWQSVVFNRDYSDKLVKLVSSLISVSFSSLGSHVVLFLVLGGERMLNLCHPLNRSLLCWGKLKQSKHLLKARAVRILAHGWGRFRLNFMCWFPSLAHVEVFVPDQAVLWQVLSLGDAMLVIKYYITHISYMFLFHFCPFIWKLIWSILEATTCIYCWCYM